MSRRRRMSKRGSRRNFKRGANRVHRKNVTGGMMRGGYRI